MANKKRKRGNGSVSSSLRSRGARKALRKRISSNIAKSSTNGRTSNHLEALRLLLEEPLPENTVIIEEDDGITVVEPHKI